MEENEYINEKLVEVVGIDVQTLQSNSNEIGKIRFKTKEFDITWKPKIIKEAHEGGLKISKTHNMNLNEIPAIIKEMGELISKGQSIEVTVCYSTFDTERDGDAVRYRYIRSQKELDKWKISE